MRTNRIYGFVTRHVYEVRASIDRKVDVFFWPTIDLLIFGLLSVYVEDSNQKADFAGAIIGALIFWTLIYNIQRDIAISFLDDAWSRNLFNLLASPLSLGEMVVSILILSLLKALVSVTFITFLASLLFHFNLLSLGPIIFFYALNVFIFAWGFGFFTAAIIFRFGTRVQSVAWSLVAIIYPISGVFYPVAILPHPLPEIAHALPISYIFEGLRKIIVTGGSPAVADYWYILGLNSLYLTVGVILFVKAFQHAKSRGWFIHPT